MAVYLVIDSGTTLYPFFEKLGKNAISTQTEQWLSRVTIVTNNLPGVESLMEHGRPDKTDRYCPLAMACQLLPGAPLPVYSAVTGSETEKAMSDLKSSHSKAVFIGLSTGNWIHTKVTGSNFFPMPLARGTGHRPFKEVLFNSCDEVYVVASLGKVVTLGTVEEFNDKLGYDQEPGQTKDTSKEKYLPLNDIDLDNVKLVTTSRLKGRILHDLSLWLEGQCSWSENPSIEEFSEAPIGGTSHMFFDFDALPSDREEEFKIEFPHINSRDAAKKLIIR